MPHTQPLFFEKKKYLFIQSLISIAFHLCDSLEVILFTAVSVGELHVVSKSIKAWLLLRIALDWEPVK